MAQYHANYRLIICIFALILLANQALVIHGEPTKSSLVGAFKYIQYLQSEKGLWAARKFGIDDKEMNFMIGGRGRVLLVATDDYSTSGEANENPNSGLATPAVPPAR